MIIIENKTSRAKLNSEVQKKQEKHKELGGVIMSSSNSSITVPNASSDIVKQVIEKEKEEAITYSEGTIHQVIPQATKVMVVVVEAYGEDNKPVFFNALNSNNLDVGSIPLALISIPLVNYKVDSTEPLDKLLNARVKVKIINNSIATEAELISATYEDTLLHNSVLPRDYEMAVSSGVGVVTYLMNLGYSLQQIDDFLKIKVDDIMDGNWVIRLKGEGYFDKAIDKTNEFDFYIDEKKLPESWADRNLKQMKDMICHNPIIAFSAR